MANEKDGIGPTAFSWWEKYRKALVDAGAKPAVIDAHRGTFYVGLACMASYLHGLALETTEKNDPIEFFLRLAELESEINTSSRNIKGGG